MDFGWIFAVFGTAGWLASQLAGWPAGWLVGWLAGGDGWSGLAGMCCAGLGKAGLGFAGLIVEDRRLAVGGDMINRK